MTGSLSPMLLTGSRPPASPPSEVVAQVAGERPRQSAALAPRSLGLSTEQLAERQRIGVARMAAVLQDSKLLGLVEQDADGRWRPTPATAERLGVAVASLKFEHEGEPHGTD